MSEDILDVEKTQEENESSLKENMQEAVENTAEAVEETAEKVEEAIEETADKVEEKAEELVEKVDEKPNTPVDGPDTTETAPKSKKWLWIILGILAAALIGVGCYFLIKNTGKYKGFKKDRATGIYYQFYGETNDTAAMPKTGDLVGILFSLRTADSTLIPMIPNEMLMDSIGKNDLYAALRMMHVGDSATFIFNGNEFFEQMMEGQEYPFGDEPLYLDVKMYGHMPKAEFEKAKAEYEAEMAKRKGQEVEDILAYAKEHNMGKATEEGIYIKTTKKGNGPLVEQMQDVTVDYVGKLLDGTEFDNSIQRGEPFTFKLGSHQVIPGWEIAVSKLHVGEEATVLIPSSMAYGDGNQVIPPYSPLVFDIKVIKAEDPATTPATSAPALTE
ncbi:MAG: FKBP-type peptidyl-prolyl cis-trans isomerase [Bacteroidales bacterium]|nr:FKBP-type peptidyl-prolyl cis-trans isomerase [Bacteroidales bacterium]